MPLNIRNYIEQSVYEEVFDEAKKIFTFSSSRSLTQSRDFLFTHCCTKINWWKRSKMIFLAAREAFQIGDKLCKFARRVESIGDKSSRQTRGFFFFLKLTQRLKASRQTSWTSSSPLVAVLLPFQHPSWSFFDFFSIHQNLFTNNRIDFLFQWYIRKKLDVDKLAGEEIFFIKTVLKQ